MIRTNNLVVIAGMSAAGKSVLIERIRQGHCPHLCEQLGIENPSAWYSTFANQLRDLGESFVEDMILHFDLYGQMFKENGYSNLARLIESSDCATILTLYCPTRALINRNNNRIIKNLVRPKRKRRVKMTGKFLRQSLFLARPDRLAGLYDRWFTLINNSFARSYWLINSGLPDQDRASCYDPESVETYSDLVRFMETPRTASAESDIQAS